MPITLERSVADHVSVGAVVVQSVSTSVNDGVGTDTAPVQKEGSKSSAAGQDPTSKELELLDYKIEKFSECSISGQEAGALLKEALRTVEGPWGVARSTALSSPDDATAQELDTNIQKPEECSLSGQEAEALLKEDLERKEAALVQYRQIQTQSFADISIITGQELLQLISSHSGAIGREIVLVDCRSDSERKVSIIPGALPRAQVEDNLHQFKDRLIVAYCAIGRRSGNFLQHLTQKHEELKVRNLAGGLVDWMHLEGPLVDGVLGLPTNRLNLGGNGWLPYLPKSRSIDFVTEAS